MVDMVVVNNWIPESLIRKYQEHGQYPVVIDRQSISRTYGHWYHRAGAGR
ncbi:MAG: hypothetical protein R2857_11725 [Vampirovibrionales bacterium]